MSGERTPARSGFPTRLRALLAKEWRQMLRDRSNLVIGLLLPAILIVLFGYGISFDVENTRVAVVAESRGDAARSLERALDASRYFVTVRSGTIDSASRSMLRGEVYAVIRIPTDSDRKFEGGAATVQLVLNGTDAQTAKTVQGQVTGAISAWAAREAASRGLSAGGIDVIPRMWFNEASTSTWFLVPGIIVLILTIIGAFLASLLIAREWERGTFESLFATPVKAPEIVIAKVSPYLAIGLADIAMCLFAARFLFNVPIRGSLGLIVLSSVLYLFVSLLLGLLVSGAMRSQFLASQVALLVSFLPSLMFSGFIFDLRNMPMWLQPICELFPATHFMRVEKVLFLVGSDPRTVAEGMAVLALYSVLFGAACCRTLRKRLE